MSARLHPVRLDVVEQAYPSLGLRFDVWGLYPNGDRDLVRSLFLTREGAEKCANRLRAAALASGLADAILAAGALSDEALRQLEGDWRLEAMTSHWLPEVEDCTAAGADLLRRADAADGYIAERASTCFRVARSLFNEIGGEDRGDIAVKGMAEARTWALVYALERHPDAPGYLLHLCRLYAFA